MAKENREARPAKARILFGFAEVEGGDPTVVESIRALAASVVRSLQAPQPVRVVKALQDSSGNGKIPENDEEKTLFDRADAENGEAAGDGEADLLEVAEPAIAALKEPRVPKKPPAYSFVPDLNLRPSDKEHLKLFYARKKPEDQMEQLAVFVYYLSKLLGVRDIGVNHLYHCFKEVEQRVPKNILQSVHNTRARRGWLDASDPTSIRINTGGENFVEHDLPRGSPA